MLARHNRSTSSCPCVPCPTGRTNRERHAVLDKDADRAAENPVYQVLEEEACPQDEPVYSVLERP